MCLEMEPTQGCTAPFVICSPTPIHSNTEEIKVVTFRQLKAHRRVVSVRYLKLTDQINIFFSDNQRYESSHLDGEIYSH